MVFRRGLNTRDTRSARAAGHSRAPAANAGREAGATPPRTPARPGPGPISPAVLRALTFTVHRRIGGVLTGDHPAAALGAGTELAQVRPYVPGDDPRRMDWNVTARTRVPHVRVHVTERALMTWLVLDASPSMAFGTADRRKSDVLEGVALAIGHLAIRRGNRLGIVTFGERRGLALPPRAGRDGLLALQSVLAREPEPDGAGPTSLGEALHRVGRLARRSGAVVVVSDFRGPQDWRRRLLHLRGHHEVLTVEIRDPREGELPDVGEIWLADPETGRQLRVDTGNRRLRERFAAAATAERHQLAHELRAAGAHHAVLTTSGEWLRPLATFLRLRRKPGARP